MSHTEPETNTPQARLARTFSRHVQLDAPEMEELVGAFSMKSVARRSFLLRYGDVCPCEYFVIKGCLRSFYVVNDVEHTLMFATEGWWTGNLKSFLTASPSVVVIEAMEDTEVLQIERNRLDDLYQKIPKLERFFRIVLQNRLIATQDRVLNQLTMSAFERYQLFLRQYPAIEQRVAQKHIASYLGISQAFLSRLRRKKR